MALPHNEYNKRFWSEQAASVAHILQEWALAQTNLSINYGKNARWIVGKNAQSQALNRRVEIVY